LDGGKLLVVGGKDADPTPSQELLWSLPQDKLKKIIKTVSKVRETKYN